MRSILFLFAWCHAEPANGVLHMHGCSQQEYTFTVQAISLYVIYNIVCIYTANILLLDANPSVFQGVHEAW